MEKKFAYFTFPKDMSEIPVHYELVKKMPKFLYNWYIQKSCPFYISDKKILEISGYEVMIPLSKDELANNAITDIIFYKILHNLSEMGVKIVIPPKEYPQIPDIIRLADAHNPFIFLLPQALSKALKTIGKQINSAELLIIDGNYDLVEAALYILHKHVNYLTVATDEPKKYEGICSDINQETGLHVQIIPLNKNGFKFKDVYIKTSSNKGTFDFAYSQGSAVIDLSRDVKEFIELLNKRNDVLIFDGVEIKCLESYINLYMLDIILCFSCADYKRYLSGRYDLYELDEILSFIEDCGASISSFYQNGVPINSSMLSDIIKRSVSV